MKFLKMFVGLSALVCSFSAINAKTAGSPVGTNYRPAAIEAQLLVAEAKTAGSPVGTN